MNIDEMVCRVCGGKAAGYNIMGSFCVTHQDLFVRDWSTTTHDDLLDEFSSEDPITLKALVDSYPFKK